MKWTIKLTLFVLFFTPNVLHSQVFNYKIKDLGDQYFCDWIGNSFPATEFVPGSRYDDNQAFGFKHMPFQMTIIHVTRSGDIFTNGHSSERSFHGIHIKDGDIKANLTKYAFNSGGYCVTADDKYAYLGKVDKKTGIIGVTRYLKETGGFAAFDNGKGEGNATLEIGAQPLGLSIFEDKLYVAVPEMKVVKIFSLSDNSIDFESEFTVPESGQIVHDKTGVLWVQDIQNNKILAYQNSNQLEKEIQLAKNFTPKGIAIDNNNQLLICDAGDDQNIKVYGNLSASPQLVEEIGEKGGILSGAPGVYEPFKFVNPSGVGVDSLDNIYVLQNTGSGYEAPMLQVFSPERELLWEISGNEFVTVADVDPRDETLFYSTNSLYRYDYNAPVGKAFKRIANLGTNEAHHSVKVGYVNNQKLLFLLNTAGGDVKVYRFKGHRVEHYTSLKNGRGFDIDKDGTVWTSHEKNALIKFAVTGFDDSGLPVWDEGESVELPGPFNDVRRVMYDEDKDEMYLTGYTAEFPYDESFGPTEGYWKKAGRYLAKFSTWKTNPKLEWGFHTPWCDGCDREVAQSVEQEGDYVFLVVGSKSKTDDQLRRPILFVYSKTDGALVGTMQPGGNVNDRAMVDMAHSFNVHKRENGEYIIVMEDCAYAKNIVFRWTPTLTRAELIKPAKQAANIFPNPATNSVSVYGFNNFNFEIVNMNGQTVRNGYVQDSKQICLNGLKRGLYMVMLTNSKTRYLQKLVIN